ncbi:hypothetical protein [Polaromonas sp. JS666]|uniref:hypothetical protein n=1 Tax=Polaromonas sp. (strain JS666 / ATCC BAA-500) TaxID=296591 RepID=UPI0000534E27|nr:hypothetical protein [Polaromonas sp. JS666]ABE45225.1 hypothetical protein Bpro_3314 [Polaromonas sp. JS666]
MFLKVLGRIPLLQCLTYFPAQAHKSASKKFFALLFLTSLPVIVAAMLAPIPEGDAGAFAKLLIKLKDSITVSELFVYSAAFLTPILYLHYERFSDVPRSQIAEKLVKEAKGIFSGYGLVALLALLFIVFTAIAFSSTKTDAAYFQKSFLNYYLVEYSLEVYIFSLYCFYLTLLDGANAGNFVVVNRKKEDDIEIEFAERLRKRELEK